MHHISSRRRLVLLSRRTLVHSSSSHCAILLPSNRSGWLLPRLSSRRHLILLLSSHCVALSSSNCAGWLVRRLSLRHRLVLSSRCTLGLSLSNRAGWLLPRLSSRCHLVFSLRCTLVLSSSSHYAALSLSHRAVWLLRRLLSRHHLVLSSSSHCVTILLSCAGWLLCCLSLRYPLVALPTHPLVTRRLIVAWPPSNDTATIELPPAFAAATPVAPVGGGTATTVVELTIVHCQKERGSTTSGGAAPTHVHKQDSGQIRPERFPVRYGSRVPARRKGGTSGMLRPDSAGIRPEQESCPGFRPPKNGTKTGIRRVLWSESASERRFRMRDDTSSSLGRG